MNIKRGLVSIHFVSREILDTDAPKLKAKNFDLFVKVMHSFLTKYNFV